MDPLTHRVVERFLVSNKVSMEHESPEALQKYLQEHPNADKSRHYVQKDETDEERDKRLKKSPGHERARPEDFGEGGKHEIK